MWTSNVLSSPPWNNNITIFSHENTSYMYMCPRKLSDKANETWKFMLINWWTCCIATVCVGRSRSRIGLLQWAQAMVEGIAAHCDENRLQLGCCPCGPIHRPVRESCGQGPQCHIHPHRLKSQRLQPSNIPFGAWGGWLAGWLALNQDWGSSRGWCALPSLEHNPPHPTPLCFLNLSYRSSTIRRPWRGDGTAQMGMASFVQVPLAHWLIYLTMYKSATVS